MKNKLIFFVVLFIFCFNTNFGQTSSDIDAKYGKPTKAYSVSENIWMTPEFAVDGQVCRMRFYPKRISTDTNYLSNQLPFDDFRNAVDQIVPLDKRGAKKLPFDSLWTMGGGAMWAIFTYEKIRITYSASFKVDPDAWKNSKPFVFSEEALSLSDKELQSPVKPEEDFVSYRTSKAEIVTVTWLDRKCSVN